MEKVSFATKIGIFIRKHIALTMLCAIVITAVIVSCVFLGISANNNENDVFNPEFEKGQLQEDVSNGDSSGIKIPGYSSITINKGETKAYVDFFNPDENQVYFKIKLVLKETNEVLYESKLLKPAQHLYEIELLNSMQAGQYDMIIIYETFKMDENLTPRNGASVNCKLIVL